MWHRRLAPALVILGLLVAGCNSGSIPAEESSAVRPSPPASGGPTPVRPSGKTSPGAEPLPIQIERAWLGGARGVVDIPDKTFTVAVSTQSFALYVQLKPWPEADWFSRITVQGAASSLPNLSNQTTGVLSLEFPEGEAGQVITVTLPEVNGMEAVTYRLERQEMPTVLMEIHDGTNWVPVSPDRTYPRQSEMLRFTFSQPVDRNQVLEALRSPILPFNAKLDVQWKWADDQTVLINATNLPPVTLWSFGGVQAANGLPADQSIPALHLGEPAALIAVDPTTREERRLREVPVELTGGAMAPSGRNILLHGTWLQMKDLSSYETRSWLLPVDGGPGQLLHPDYTKYQYFPPDSDALQGIDRGDGMAHALSPDQTRMAKLLNEEFGYKDMPGWLYPLDLVIQDRNGKVLQQVRNVMRLFAPPKDWPLTPKLIWSPDGKRIAALSDEAERHGAIVVVDLESGEVKPVVSLLEELGWGTPNPFAWNGDRFIVERSVFDASGRLERTLPGSGTFSPDGKWILVRNAAADHADPAWGVLGVTPVDGGEVTIFGEGLFVGWLPNGELLLVRWPDWRHRYVQLPL